MPKFSTAEELYKEFIKESGKFMEFSHNEWKTRISSWYIKYMLEHGAHIVDEDEHASLINESISFANYVIEKMHNELNATENNNAEQMLSINVALVEDGKMPKKAHDSDAGFDCYARKIEKIENMVKYWLGFAIEIPVGYIGLLFPRSSVYKTGMSLTNCVGVIDPGFTGEVSAIYRPLDTEKEIYFVGDRVVQLIIIKNTEVELNQVNFLSDTERGDGSYGSTGN